MPDGHHWKKNNNYWLLAEIPGVARDSSTNIHVLFLTTTPKM
jgi:hypothetical protein